MMLLSSLKCLINKEVSFGCVINKRYNNVKMLKSRLTNLKECFEAFMRFFIASIEANYLQKH